MSPSASLADHEENVSSTPSPSVIAPPAHTVSSTLPPTLLPGDASGDTDFGGDSQEITFTPFPRQLPDDILGYICAALHGKKQDVLRMSTEYKALQRTLLSIQLVSQAGWRAATPLLWENVKPAKDADYISFFAPITRNMARLSDDKAWETIASALIRHDPNLPSDIQRFFKATHWTRTFHIRSSPPSEIHEEILSIENLHEQALFSWPSGTSLHRGKCIDRYLGDHLCSLLSSDLWNNEVDSLSALLGQLITARITLWDMPIDVGSSYGTTWDNFDTIGLQNCWGHDHLTVYDPGVGQLPLSWGIDSSSIVVVLTAQRGHDNFHESREASLRAVGRFIVDRLLEYGHNRAEVILDVQTYIGCRCGCDDIMAGSKEEEQEIRRLVDAVIGYSYDELVEYMAEDEDDTDGYVQHYMEEIRSAFQAKRLTIRPHPR